VAMIALPRFTAPRIGPIPLRALATNRYVAAGGAAVLLAAAASGLVMLLGPGARDPSAVRVPLADVLEHAPPGWRQTLPPLHGAMIVSQDVMRLSARPLAPLAGVSWNQPGGETPRPLPASGALPPAPIIGFFAPGPGGPLPIIAQDGRTPFDAYKRPFHSDGRPKIALVIGGLGLNARATQAAIETLPGEITLSFVPYSEGLQGWVDMARAHGHEVLLDAPMEPLDYPDNDPGPYTLLSAAQPQETAKRTEWILSRAVGYFGLTNYLGSRFVTSDAGMNAFTQTLRTRGVAFIDDGQAARRGGGLPRASADRIIDEPLASDAIGQRLTELEGVARKNGQALGSGLSFPVTLGLVAAWTQGLEQRGLQLAPASALMVRR
jgi:polysaccharide deacetylase 2 family uncharacterized protein YibQ